MKIPWGVVQGVVSLALVLLLLAWEFLAPARPRPKGVLRRWGRNLTIGGIGIFATHLVPGGVLVAVSAWGRSVGIGPLKDLPPLLATVLTALILDMALWAQHKVSHEWPWLWRLHRVHHGDQAMDITTAFRFHPVELGVSLIWKSTVVLTLGGPVAGVLLFESLLLVGNLFEHANGYLPDAVDRILRSTLVTPRLHAIHHATDPRDQRSNFGFFFIWWDRAFRTIRVLPSGSASPAIGLGDGRERSLLELLRQPLEPIHEPVSGA